MLRMCAKVMIGLSLLLLVTAPGWTALFVREKRGRLVLGIVLVGLVSGLMLLLTKGR